MREPRRRAFTLMEMVVAIVIIGVMAAIAAPRISRGSDGAGGAAARADLAVLRKAIDIYAAEHGGAFPGLNEDGLGGATRSEEALVSQLTLFSDYSGQASRTREYPFIYGPYLSRGIPAAPIGTFAGSSSVKVVTSGPEREPSGNYGWVYNVLTGVIILNSAEADESDLTDKFEMGPRDFGGMGAE